MGHQKTPESALRGQSQVLEEDWTGGAEQQCGGGGGVALETFHSKSWGDSMKCVKCSRMAGEEGSGAWGFLQDDGPAGPPGEPRRKSRLGGGERRCAWFGGCRPGAHGRRGSAERGGGGEGCGRPGSSGKRVPAAGTGSPSPETAPPRLQGARVPSPPSRDTMKRLGDIMLPDLPHRNPCNKVTPGVRALRGAAGGAAGTRGSGAWGEVGGDQAGDDSSLPQGGPGSEIAAGRQWAGVCGRRGRHRARTGGRASSPAGEREHSW